MDMVELHRHIEPFAARQANDVPLRRIAESALREVEHVCTLVRRISDTCVEELPDQVAIAHRRGLIAWWSRKAESAGRRGDENGPDTEVSKISTSHLSLTPSEREVLRLVSRGLTKKERALRTTTGPRTFESHRARVSLAGTTKTRTR
ncbi:hypothetical protein LQG66_07045 [Bradyrhizobium ontarionense]|uniref:HTH luxR-type domain-containing protein n=1 Tax=Bradyrhizobium ontarionense TaxID=2898149 RepID=A0ABY3RFH0_9BRAD|nr:hypothetical protein [Bradyrhizobium sp. A19]UFZ06058.1 hypothetical protein LQG66_07045 [Bradyrhizobium sp. A19]